MGKIVLLCITLFIFSCASEKPIGRTEAEVLYKEAKILIKNKRYIMAMEKLNLLRTRYSYSIYAIRAELTIANVYFLQRDYKEAAAAYILFRDFHPKYKDMVYVVFRIADSFYEQAPSTHDRDLSPFIEAFKYYNEVAQKYSHTKYAQLAQKKIVKIQNMMDKKEKYIADFYFRTKVYHAAHYRYLEILKIVKDKSIRLQAMERIIQVSHLLKEYKKCHFYINRYFPHLKQISKKRLGAIKRDCQLKQKESNA